MERASGKIWSNVNVTANVRSDIVALTNDMVHFDVSFVDGNTLVGSVQVDVCSNYNPTNVEAANWQPVTLSTGLTSIAVNTEATDPQGESIDISTAAKYVSLYFTYTSGDGTVNAYAHVQES